MTGNSEINGNSEFFGFFGWLGSSPSLIAVSPSPLCVVPMVSWRRHERQEDSKAGRPEMAY